MSRQRKFLAKTREKNGRSFCLDHMGLGFFYSNNSPKKELSLSEANQLLNSQNPKGKGNIFAFCRDETGRNLTFWVLRMQENGNYFSVDVDSKGTVESLDFFLCVG